MFFLPILMQLFTPELIQVSLAIATAPVTGFGSYYAAQKGVAVALAKHEVRLEYIEKRRNEDSERHHELAARVLDLERAAPHRIGR